jgi:hypothetical protein
MEGSFKVRLYASKNPSESPFTNGDFCSPFFKGAKGGFFDDGCRYKSIYDGKNDFDDILGVNALRLATSIIRC